MRDEEWGMRMNSYTFFHFELGQGLGKFSPLALRSHAPALIATFLTVSVYWGTQPSMLEK